MVIQAKKNVRLYLNRIGSTPQKVGRIVVQKPINLPMWVDLKSGEKIDNVSIVMGVSAKHMPNENPIGYEEGEALVVVNYESNEFFEVIDS